MPRASASRQCGGSKKARRNRGFHRETEHRIKFALKLKEGAFEHLRIRGALRHRLLRTSSSSDSDDRVTTEKPLCRIIVSVENSYVAGVMGHSLQVIGERANEGLVRLAAAGRLIPDGRQIIGTS